jgi:hypothetical protein
MRLVLNLQDGFQDDTVVLIVNGEEQFHKEQVSTNYAIGLADQVTVEDLEEEDIVLEVNVPTREIHCQQEVHLSVETYIAISIYQNEIRLETSDHPFLYF